MKKLIPILFLFLLGCKYVPEFTSCDDCIKYSDWEQYKVDCRNDSTMQRIQLNKGELINGVMVFEYDTIYTYKTATWSGFLENKKTNKKPMPYLFGPKKRD